MVEKIIEKISNKNVIIDDNIKKILNVFSLVDETLYEDHLIEILTLNDLLVINIKINKKYCPIICQFGINGNNEFNLFYKDALIIEEKIENEILLEETITYIYEILRYNIKEEVFIRNDKIIKCKYYFYQDDCLVHKYVALNKLLSIFLWNTKKIVYEYEPWLN